MKAVAWAVVARALLALTSAAAAMSVRSTFGDGVYRVWQRRAARDLRARGSSFCHWARLKVFQREHERDPGQRQRSRSDDCDDQAATVAFHRAVAARGGARRFRGMTGRR